MQIEWIKPTYGGWHYLFDSNLPNAKVNGVYVIGVAGGDVVRTGQGFIEDRLIEHRNDPRILSYGTFWEPLVVTWAEVDGVWRDNVEVYLENELDPAIRTRLPLALPIPVNLPWEPVSWFSLLARAYRYWP